MIPYVNAPATISYGSDRHPATVISVDGNVVGVQWDKWEVIEGGEHDGSAEYKYHRDPEGGVSHYRWRRGKWEPVARNDKGRWVKVGYGGLAVGFRQRYYDPHF